MNRVIQKKKIIRWTVFAACVLVSKAVLADTILLKSGLLIDATVVTETDDQVKVDINGVTVTYEPGEIVTIYRQLDLPGIDEEDARAKEPELWRSFLTQHGAFIQRLDRLMVQCREYQQQCYTLIEGLRKVHKSQEAGNELTMFREHMKVLHAQFETLQVPAILAPYRLEAKSIIEFNMQALEARLDGRRNDVIKYSSLAAHSTQRQYRFLRTLYCQHNAPHDLVKEMDEKIKKINKAVYKYETLLGAGS